MPSLACLEGEISPPERALVPISDRGFLFGDAAYEVFRIYRGRCWLEAEHFARLGRSMQALRIVGLDFGRLGDRLHRTIERSGIAEGTAYIQVTRGVAPRAHAFPDPPVPPTELIVVRPYDDAPTAASRASGVATISHPDLRWKRCDIKTTNLLPNVLALQAAHDAGCSEAILVDSDGRITEAAHSSVLWVRGGRLESTPDGPAILPGITRALVRGPQVVESSITLDELILADEVVLVGTTFEVMPVVTIDDAAISGGRPGPVSRGLQAAYRRSIDDWLSGG